MVAPLVLVIGVALGGCGVAADPSRPEASSSAGEVTVGPDGVQSITLVSGDDYRFVPAEFTVTPGQVSLTLENAATQLTHSLAYPPERNPEDITESIPVVAPTESDTIEFTVDTPGEYAFICSFHEAQGHTGVMTVQP
ncbi:MAG: cupredoxin domain-containing protein [Actinomycetota bacterium]|nr:cupredoxin domain-containing protein [Actinomycetota bacterium]